MSGRLRCASFHSVKGGVGKSTLSALAAVWLARARSDRPVYLVDMDLTGTSLADVLPLRPPSWGADEGAPLPLHAAPAGFHDRERVQDLLDLRAEREDAAPAVGVPFLNDFLLFATPSWDEQREMPVRSVCWQLAGGPENLHVLPSSALPVDLERTLPVIYDEEHAAFLEARLEHLLDAIVDRDGEAAVVFDTPPTIPGLSRSVLSLAFRLSRTPKTPLEEGESGYMPHRLREADLTWRALLVSTLDLQDVRAAERWLSLVTEEERKVILPLLNRQPAGDRLQIEEMVRRALEHVPNPLFERALEVKEDLDLQFFRGEREPPLRDELIRHLLGEP